jgi:hypothetical protein
MRSSREKKKTNRNWYEKKKQIEIDTKWLV